MSERESFPNEEAVGEAYGEVILASQSMEQADLALEALEDSLYPLTEEVNQLLGKLGSKHLLETENERVAGLNIKHGQLFETIGIKLHASDISATADAAGLASARHIVPELLEPDRFTGYLETIGCQAVYVDPIHHQLTEDVVENIYDRVDDFEKLILAFNYYKSDSSGLGVEIQQRCRDAYLHKFRAIRPFYLRANFQRGMPAFAKLEKRVFSEPVDPL